MSTCMIHIAPRSVRSRTVPYALSVRQAREHGTVGCDGPSRKTPDGHGGEALRDTHY